MDAIEQQFTELEGNANKYNSWQTVLEAQPTVFENLEACREAINLRCLMWRSLNEWTEMNEIWYKTAFTQVDAKFIASEAEKYTKKVMRLEKSLEANPIQARLKEAVMTFKEAMPIVIALRNENLQESHWNSIQKLIDKDFEINAPDFTLKSLIDLDVNKHQEDITAISTQATQEHNLSLQIARIDDIWKKQAFEVGKDEKTDCFILKDMDEVYQNLDETLADINMILGSRFVKPLRDVAERWKRDILYLGDMVDEWLKCQRDWRYLKTIFQAADIKKSLPDETKKFEGVDKFFTQLMVKTQKKALVLPHARNPNVNVLEQLQANNETLYDIQKKLEDYMEQKRSDFPRFYFLSNDELIDILAHSADLDVIQLHLKTCFDNVVRLDIGEDGCLVAMNSAEKEKVHFKKKTIKARGTQVEVWLNHLQAGMRDSLRQYMKAGFDDYQSKDKERKQFVRDHCGQVVAAIAQVMWCTGCENAISSYSSDPLSLQDWWDVNVSQLAQLTALVRGDLTDLERKVIVALVTTDVHARDIVKELADDKVQSLSDFKWQKQLRYYYQDEEVAGEP